MIFIFFWGGGSVFKSTGDNQTPVAVQSAFTVSLGAGTKTEWTWQFMAVLTISSTYRAIPEPLVGTHKIIRLVEKPWFRTFPDSGMHWLQLY